MYYCLLSGTAGNLLVFLLLVPVILSVLSSYTEISAFIKDRLHCSFIYDGVLVLFVLWLYKLVREFRILTFLTGDLTICISIFARVAFNSGRPPPGASTVLGGGKLLRAFLARKLGCLKSPEMLTSRPKDAASSSTWDYSLTMFLASYMRLATLGFVGKNRST